ncbi:hypothetical protein FPV67DRAFT_305173 [Lyophyllum atratum]|nr:hypothetical protein FPV67DRAFT_305173 [Lyophyllum atratum]
MSTFIPPELSDRIIDHCHDDKATLRSCHSVCKDWAAASRYHLFSSVALNSENMSFFLDLLESPSGISVGHLVTNLKLQPYLDYLYLLEAMPILTQHLRPRSLTLMVDTTISYQDRLGIYRYRDDLTPFHGCFPTLLSLNLDIVCGTFLQMVELVASFPLLEELTIDRPCWMLESKETPPQCLALPRQIHELTVLGGKARLFRWLSQHHPPLHLARLILDLRTTFNWKLDSKFINAFLRSIGRSLQHLTLRAFDRAASLLGHINLVHLHDLRSIKIEASENVVPIVLRLLSQLSSTSPVEEVEFSPSFSEANEDHWRELGLLLEGPRFNSLRRVILNVKEQHIYLIPTIHSLRSIMWVRDEMGVARRFF